MGPLEGLKVIDLTHVMAGPTCTLMLADMGADVIKIERMPGGDDTRRSIPPTIDGEAAAFMMMNRNKRGRGARPQDRGRQTRAAPAAAGRRRRGRELPARHARQAGLRL